MVESTEADRQVLDHWWQTFVTTGELPAGLVRVQGRLIRAVHRGELPSGPVHIKTMTFPRKKDRLRYAFRALPAAHEANMLGFTRAASIPCPEVVAVRVQRRAWLPHRSMLVLRSLPLSDGAESASQRLNDEIELATRLVEAGIHHRDLHTENFVRMASGELAVLDMQSASRIRSDQISSPTVRLAVASRLLRDRDAPERASALVRMRSLGLLHSDAEYQSVNTRVKQLQLHYQGSRIRRCLMNSTEFSCRTQLLGTEYRMRGELPPGRWWRGGRSLRRAWIGQRARHLEQGTQPVFAAFFQKWWWLGGGAALYVPILCEDERIEEEVRLASSVGLAQAPRSGRIGDSRRT
ncbi:MAG: tRNA A-37 threonylcarbamoyl transferase component Bud32 [Planctomycetota bacterium]|jgi:tRNA A-37 threonylcarbamoyl transferase component Bud32